MDKSKLIRVVVNALANDVITVDEALCLLDADDNKCCLIEMKTTTPIVTEATGRKQILTLAEKLARQAAIAKDARDGMGLQQIKAKYGVADGTVYTACRKHNRQHG